MNQPALLQIQSDPRATIATIQCREFDFQRTTQFKTESAAAAGGPPRLPLILDLANVGYMPSLTLGALVELRNRFAQEHRQLTLVGLQPAIIKLMQASGMLGLFDVRTSIDEAITALAKAAPASGQPPN